MKKADILKCSITILLSFAFTAALVSIMVRVGRSSVRSGEEAADGVIELAEGCFEDGKIVPLDGYWEFYPGEYISSSAEAEGDPVMAKVPGYWSGSGISGKGTGTYRLVLKLPETHEKLAVRITGNALPFRLFVNGEYLCGEGQIGSGPSDTKFSMKTVTASFEPEAENEIMIQTCNFTLDSGLIRYPIFLGTEERIERISAANVSRGWMIFGALSIMAVYYLILFLNNKNNVSKGTLLMFLLCIMDILYVLNSNEYLIYSLFPNITYDAINKMVYVLPTCGGTLLIYFVDVFYRDLSWKPVKYVSLAKVAVLLALMLLFSYSVRVGKATLSNVFQEIEFLYSIAILSYAISKKRPYAGSILAATVILNAAIIYTVLFYANIVYTPYGGMVSVGNLVVILCFAIVVAVDLNESYRAVIRLSDSLTEATKLKDEFLTNTSHEIRTPLNSMVALTESVIMESGDSIGGEQKETLQMVSVTGKRLASLVNDILDYSRMKHGDLKLMLSVFSIEKLLYRLNKEFALLAEKKSIRVLLDVRQQLPLVYADEYRIIQVIYNLVGNAIKFTPEGGAVKISARAEKNTVFISVEDNGMGIPEDRLGDIFKSFEQANANIAETYGGLGLGLSISKQIVESHGRSIDVKSRLGEGSAFTFGIPANENQNAVINDEAEEAIVRGIKEPASGGNKLEISGTRPETVIIIDDNYNNIAGVSGILKTEGYGVKGFTRAEEGIEEAFSNGQASLIILDLMMPEISGYEVCRRVRERYSLLEMPVLILTAKVQTDSVTRALKSGANDYLTKPFDGKELIARVNTLCRLKEVSEMAVANETKFLQAQIKPHFLYNALNTISALCIDDAGKASDLIDCLCVFLRNSFNPGEQRNLVCLKKELEIINAYVEIEKARFGDKIEIEYDIEENVQCMIPPLILQPIIENSIRHGLMKKEGKGTVRLAIHGEATDIRFSVTDDGTGISERRREGLLNGNNESDGVGLKNINKRLIKNFGRGLEIESRPGSGTVVSFSIPKIIDIGGNGRV